MNLNYILSGCSSPGPQSEKCLIINHPGFFNSRWYGLKLSPVYRACALPQGHALSCWVMLLFFWTLSHSRCCKENNVRNLRNSLWFAVLSFYINSSHNTHTHTPGIHPPCAATCVFLPFCLLIIALFCSPLYFLRYQPYAPLDNSLFMSNHYWVPNDTNIVNSFLRGRGEKKINSHWHTVYWRK